MHVQQLYVYYSFSFDDIWRAFSTYKAFLNKALNSFSSIVKSRSNLFLGSISTKQSGLSFLLKETVGAFGGIVNYKTVHLWHYSDYDGLQ